MSESGFPDIPSIDEMAARVAETKQRIEGDEDLQRELLEGRPSGNPITLGPRLPDPKTWAEDQVQGAKDKAKKWLRNTTHPKKNFKEEALRPRAKARYKDSMEEVIEKDLWAGGMELVDESETMRTIEKRGAGAYSSGVADRAEKIQRTVNELHGDRLALAIEIDAMDVSTDEAREAKMVANKRGLQGIGKRRRGG